MVGEILDYIHGDNYKIPNIAITDISPVCHMPDVIEAPYRPFLMNEQDKGINVILELDEESYYGGENGDYHPITWYHNYDGGRSFYTGLGHLKEVYSNKMFIKLLEQGILYASFVD